jgi:hypothetical protein
MKKSEFQKSILIIYFYKTLYKSIKKHDHNNVTKVSSHKENITEFGGDQHFCKKNKDGQKKIFQAELEFHFKIGVKA